MKIQAIVYGIVFLAMSLALYFIKDLYFITQFSLSYAVYLLSVVLFAFGLVMILSLVFHRKTKHEPKKSSKLEEAHKLAEDILGKTESEVMTELKDLKKLEKEGIITRHDFEHKKKELLDRL